MHGDWVEEWWRWRLQHKGKRNVAQCVCTHQGTTEGPVERLLGGDCKTEAWLLSISEALLFSPIYPGCPASQWRCSETQHTN